VVNTPDILKRRNAECVNKREVRIFNIKTGEILRLNATFEELTTIVVEMLRGKYERQKTKSNEEFLQDCERYMDGYIRRKSIC
jgi:hypothetical protein